MVSVSLSVFLDQGNFFGIREKSGNFVSNDWQKPCYTYLKFIFHQIQLSSNNYFSFLPKIKDLIAKEESTASGDNIVDEEMLATEKLVNDAASRIEVCCNIVES